MATWRQPCFPDRTMSASRVLRCSRPRQASSGAALRVPAGSPAVRRWPSSRLPRVLLCDLDGTLIDSMPTLAEIAAEVMERGLRDAADPGARALPGDLRPAVRQQLEEIFPGDPRNARASEMFEARKPARCSRIQMPAETRRALESLRARGVRIVVSSNNGVENVDTFARSVRLRVRPDAGVRRRAGQGAPALRRRVARLRDRPAGDAVRGRFAARRRDCRAGGGPVRRRWRRPSRPSASCSASRRSRWCAASPRCPSCSGRLRRMQAVLLAAGLGSRLGALTERIPKALIAVGGRAAAGARRALRAGGRRARRSSSSAGSGSTRWPPRSRGASCRSR